MAKERTDPLSRAQREMISRLTDVAHALADLNPVSLAGRHAEEALLPVQHVLHVLQSLAGYGALAIEPLVALVEAQRELADHMAEWAELQRQFAEHMAEWAELQRGLADSLSLVLRPLAEGGQQVADVLRDVSGKPAAKPRSRARAKPASKG